MNSSSTSLPSSIAEPATEVGPAANPGVSGAVPGIPGLNKTIGSPPGPVAVAVGYKNGDEGLVMVTCGTLVASTFNWFALLLLP